MNIGTAACITQSIIISCNCVKHFYTFKVHNNLVVSDRPNLIELYYFIRNKLPNHFMCVSKVYVDCGTTAFWYDGLCTS